MFFDHSPAFRLHAGRGGEGRAAGRVVRQRDKPLRSGWAWGQHYLQGSIAVAEAQVGKGSLFLFGPEITFRAQPHGTFKFLFNGCSTGRRRRRTTGGAAPTAQGQ